MGSRPLQCRERYHASIGRSVADFTLVQRRKRLAVVPQCEVTRLAGKQKLGPISKRGDRYLRRILVVGACAVLRYARHKPEKYPWLTQLLARKPFKVVAVALANKMARIAWALLAKGGTYRVPTLAAAA